MQLTLLISAIASLAAVASAADCAGRLGSKPNMDLWWTAREAACKGDSKSFNDPRVGINWVGNKPDTQLCWDATENMFNQCIKNGYRAGYYNKDGTTLRVERKFK
ncbi:hypothetical protein EDC01DRAFT_320825 [Geopyxis carbonaria]|nr:hypothetical protein EDC01DRAFT_320825 [Geopyxis carbonaria]